MNNAHGLNEEELKKSIERLSHFSPNTSDKYNNQLLDYIVIDCALDFGTTITTAKDIKDKINKNLLVQFEEDEIISSAIRLSKKNLVKIISSSKKFEKPKIQILEKAEEEVTNNRQEITNLENEVLNKWKDEVLIKYNNHEDVKTNIYRLVNLLQSFTSKMFVKHGVETVSLLYPGEGKVKNWLKNNSSEIINGLSNSDNTFFNNIVKVEIPKFFQNNDPKRKQYISNLFNASFFWHLIQVDENCSKILTQVTKGQKLFLDNNILYSIIGIHGKDALESTHSMLKFANELGYQLYVTTKTLDEFQNTLKWQLNEYKASLPVSKSLAKLALDELGENSFLTTYWANLVEKNINIHEFIAEISYIDDILEGLNINTFYKYRDDIESSEDIKDEMSTLRLACGEHLNIHVVEHDAFHRILINKVRKGAKYNFNQAKAWFLTHDHKLPEYSKKARKGSTQLPFCITTNEWIQINRPFLTRTKSQLEFEKSFNILVTQPYVRSMLPVIPLEKVYNAVLGKLDRYKGMTAEAASKIVSDTHFMMSMTNIDDEKIFDEKIENRLIDLNKELRSQNENLILEKKDKESEIEKLKVKVDTISTKLEETKGILDKKEDTLIEKENTYKKQIESLEDKVFTTTKSNEDLFDRTLEFEIKAWKRPAYFALFAVLIILILIILTFAFQTAHWNIVSTFFDWAEKQTELRKEIFKWIIILILGAAQYFLYKFIWQRLLNKKFEKSYIKSIINSNTDDKL